jgi:hypothetical protein
MVFETGLFFHVKQEVPTLPESMNVLVSVGFWSPSDGAGVPSMVPQGNVEGSHEKADPKVAGGYQRGISVVSDSGIAGVVKPLVRPHFSMVFVDGGGGVA